MVPEWFCTDKNNSQDLSWMSLYRSDHAGNVRGNQDRAI